MTSDAGSIPAASTRPREPTGKIERISAGGEYWTRPTVLVLRGALGDCAERHEIDQIFQVLEEELQRTKAQFHRKDGGEFRFR